MLSLKELVLVFIIAAAIFKLAKPIALLFSAEKDFLRRRNAWFVLTAAAFIAPNFWLFALVAIPTLIVTGRKDSNPAALYLLLLQVIPSIPINVPMVGLSHLFEVDNYMLLALFVMLPAALRLRGSKDRGGIRGLQSMDIMLISYGLLTAFLYLHPEISRGVLNAFTFTDALRRAFTFFFGIYIPYYVISRSASTRQAISEHLAAVCLACALMAGIAIFESARHWLLYGEMAARWGHAYSYSQYYMRGESLRSMASAGHPLVLGYLLEIAFGFWLYLQSHPMSRRYRLGITLLLWLGLIAAYSRGPWIGAVCIFFVFSALRPRAFSGLAKAGSIALIITIAVWLSPLGDKIISVMPFLGGKVDSSSVVYRHQLFERAVEIIQASPILGDQYALLKMQDLRQGEGIIDVINAYVSILLANGFLGLSLLIGCILLGLFRALTLSRRAAATDGDFSILGASLVACILGTLLMMVDGSFGTGLERMFYILAALAAAYSNIGKSWQPAQPDSPSIPGRRRQPAQA